MTYSATKFEAATSNRLYKKIIYLTFDLDLGVKVTRNVAQYPLHHVPYSPTKFEVANSNGIGGDTFTRNVTDGRTDARTDRRTNVQTDRQTDGQTDGRRTDFDTKLIYLFFSKEKSGFKDACINMVANILSVYLLPRSWGLRQ